MKITGTNAYIILDIDGRKIKVEGERVLGGFFAEIKSMQQFEPPHENTPLTDEIKQKYIDEAIKKTAGSHRVIHFV
ncbi:Imm74 family immunity protein [Escherichia coli]|nr:Imm74 family immunity protein [Escherichia coli]